MPLKVLGLLGAAGIVVAGASLLLAKGRDETPALPPDDADRVEVITTLVYPYDAGLTPGPPFQGQLTPPRPDGTALAELTQIIKFYEDNDLTPEPPYRGEFNGFVYDRASPPATACEDHERPQGVFTEHGSALLVESGLDYTVTYAPPGFSPRRSTDRFGQTSGHVSAGQCSADGAALWVSENWTSATGEFSIDRWAGSARVGIEFEVVRLEATTINGRPAVIVNPRYDGEAVWIFMRDETSAWLLYSEVLGLEELLRIAQGLE